MGNRRERELDEELQAHLRMSARDRIERGSTPEQARRDALREFGNMALIQETTREMWGWTSLERIARDTRYAVRALRHNPGFALTAVLSLAIGIGANTASFSLADALLFRPL